MIHQSVTAPVRSVRGVGPAREAALARLGVETVDQLLLHLPRAYLDRTRARNLGDGSPGHDLLSFAEVTDARLTGRGLRDFAATIADESGAIRVVWFGQPYLRNTLRPGTRILVMGRFRDDPRARLVNPEFEIVPADEPTSVPGIVPIYPLAAGLSQSFLRKAIGQALSMPQAKVNMLRPDFRFQGGLSDRYEALQAVHHPRNLDEVERGRSSLAYEELLLQQLLLQHSRRTLRGAPGRPLRIAGDDPVSAALERLPYRLTDGQLRALAAILDDLQADRPMLRLLQGDVGAGKTVVALLACLHVAAAGAQSCLLVPTEILARQHERSMFTLLQGSALRVEVLVGGMGSLERRTVLDDLALGRIHVLITTHAVLERDVRFRDLGMIVVDEQHRFGVLQRLELRGKATVPHMLLMTATPIPRTLEAILVGDLDTTTIPERPHGRPTIQTHLVPRTRWDAMLRFTGERLRRGEQAFFIYPLIDAPDRTGSRGAIRMHREISAHPAMQGLEVVLLHGRLSMEDRAARIGRLLTGSAHAVVATTIVEVGIDLPRATIMVIGHPERFGLTQIHQLRGRVGRGSHDAAYCFLLQPETMTDSARERLRVLAGESDGFRIAEADLRLRGPGEALGTFQSGFPRFRVADPIRDADLASRARTDARRILDSEDGESVVQALAVWANRLGVPAAKMAGV